MVEVVKTQNLTFAGLPVLKMINAKPGTMLVSADYDIKKLKSTNGGFVLLTEYGKMGRVYINKDIKWLEKNVHLLEPIDKGGMPIFAFDKDGNFVYGIVVFEGTAGNVEIPEEKYKHCFVKFVSCPQYAPDPWDFCSYL